MSGTWELDPDDVDFAIKEWDEDQKTKPIGMEPLSDKTDYSKHPISDGTPCYMCGLPYMASGRLRGGQPVCKRCLDNNGHP